MKRSLMAVVGLIFTLACDTDQESNPIKEVFLSAAEAESPPAVAFRFGAGTRATVGLFQLPSLTELPWAFDPPTLRPTEFTGFVSSLGQIFYQGADGAFATFELASGRAYLLDTLTALATIGPTGIAYVARSDSTVATVNGRRLDIWPSKLPMVPAAIWGTTANRLVTLFDRPTRHIRVISNDRVGDPINVPNGPLAASLWADIVAIATDSGLVSVEPSTQTIRFEATSRPINAVAVSPSGHRFLAAQGNRLVAFDRFGFELLGAWTTRTPIDAIRVDPLGRFLLLRSGSEVLIARYDVLRDDHPTLDEVRVDGDWADDLPTVTARGEVLIHQGDEVVSINPNTGAELGRTSSDGHRWLSIAWNPTQPLLQMAQQNRPIAVDTARIRFWTQVFSTSNEDRAQELVDRLRQGGIDALIQRPDSFSNIRRVVIGPFPTREEAEQLGSRLGMAYYTFPEFVDSLFN